MPSIGSVIGSVLAILLVAYLYPTAITAVAAVNDTTFGAVASPLWDLIQLFAVIAALVIIFGPSVKEF